MPSTESSTGHTRAGGSCRRALVARPVRNTIATVLRLVPVYHPNSFTSPPHDRPVGPKQERAVQETRPEETGVLLDEHICPVRTPGHHQGRVVIAEVQMRPVLPHGRLRCLDLQPAVRVEHELTAGEFPQQRSRGRRCGGTPRSRFGAMTRPRRFPPLQKLDAALQSCEAPTSTARWRSVRVFLLGPASFRWFGRTSYPRASLAAKSSALDGHDRRFRFPRFPTTIDTVRGRRGRRVVQSHRGAGSARTPRLPRLRQPPRVHELAFPEVGGSNRASPRRTRLPRASTAASAMSA